MAKKYPKKCKTAKAVVEPEPVMEEVPAANEMPAAEETHVVEEMILVEGPPAESNSGSHHTSQRPRRSPYRSSRVTLHIGPDRVVYYVPKDLLCFPPWVKTNRWGEIALTDVDVDTGHTLVHYLHTGAYQTIDTDAHIPMKEACSEFKKALLTYIMADTYELLNLKLLAICEMEDQGTKMDIFEVLEVIKEDFAKLDQTSWFHKYLHKKARAAFEEDHTVFTRDAFLDTLDNAALNKFMLICLVKLYEEKVSRMITTEKELSQKHEDCNHTIRSSSVEEAVPKRNMAIQQEFITPLVKESIINECCSQEAFEQESVSTEEFCTISCPSSKCPNEPTECLSDASPDTSAPVEQCYLSNSTVRDCSIRETRAPMKNVAMIRAVKVPNNRRGEDMKVAQPAPKLELLEDSIYIPSKKETMKQRKVRMSREQQEQQFLGWEELERLEAKRWETKLITPEVHVEQL